MRLDQLATYVHRVIASKGFHTPSGIDTENQKRDVLGKLMLVTTEVAEAAEAVRHDDYENYKEELADTVIRILDLCGAQDIDLEDEIMKKMETNEGRPKLHGKQVGL